MAYESVMEKVKTVTGDVLDLNFEWVIENVQVL